MALALLVALAVAPTSTTAGCLHPAVSNGGLASGFDRLDRAGALAPSEEAPRTPRPVGCQGPSCSGRDGSPMIPTSFDPPRFPEWAILPMIRRDAACQWSPIDRSGEDSPPVGETMTIFHPPRLIVRER